MLPSSTKLTIFQRGIAQKCVVFCTYVITISVTAFNAFTILINARDEKFFLDLIFIGTFCGIIGLLIIRQVAKLQWSRPVILPKVIEFKQAMQHIGIHTPEDRIDFVRKQGIPIFIASKPFLEMEQYSIPVRLYTFAYNSTLSDANIFSTYIGQQRLCLDAADYEYLLEKYGREALSAYTARIRDLEEMSWNKIKYYLPKKPNIRIKSEPFPAEKRVWKVGKTPNGLSGVLFILW